MEAEFLRFMVSRFSSCAVETRDQRPESKNQKLLLLLLTVIAASCAIPVMPTGGPQDKVPPVIVLSEPATESVNVSSNAVRIVFSEFVDQASFAQALSVTPAFDRPLTYRWRKKRVDIAFPESLRENTTYILTIDTSLRDANRVALSQPITLAFSTGPEINRGKISGRVLDALAGTGVANFDVFAYARPDSTLPDSLPDGPAYRTQTDQNGTFNFDYLSEQPYFVIALLDRNRNRKPDGIEPFAVPPKPVLWADSTGTDPSLRWLSTVSDTIAPRLQRVRAISNQRFMLRFSESIQLRTRDPSQWSLQDSVSNEAYAINDIYLYPEDPRQVYIKTPQLFSTTHLLQPAGIADSSGNPIAAEAIAFRPSSSSDTLQLRFLGFSPATLERNDNGAFELAPGQGAGIRFNQPVTNEVLTSFVTIEDSSKQAYPLNAISADGSVFDLSAGASIPAGMPFTVSVDGNGVGVPDTVYTRVFEKLGNNGLGELSGVVLSEDSHGQAVVEIYPSTDKRASMPVASKIPDANGNFTFTHLPDKSQYNFRAFLDLNANRKWDGGHVIPYQAAEPVTWYSDSLQVRAKWEKTLSDTLKIKR